MNVRRNWPAGRLAFTDEIAQHLAQGAVHPRGKCVVIAGIGCEQDRSNSPRARLNGAHEGLAAAFLAEVSDGPLVVRKSLKIEHRLAVDARK